ncbi:hypothetical protein [Paenibacillus luteus]|nr:hypothetical protein [Paenibacillus luteus]
MLQTYRWLEEKLGELRIQPSLLTKQVFEQIQLDDLDLVQE